MSNPNSTPGNSSFPPGLMTPDQMAAETQRQILANAQQVAANQAAANQIAASQVAASQAGQAPGTSLYEMFGSVYTPSTTSFDQNLEDTVERKGPDIKQIGTPSTKALAMLRINFCRMYKLLQEPGEKTFTFIQIEPTSDLATLLPGMTVADVQAMSSWGMNTMKEIAFRVAKQLGNISPGCCLSGIGDIAKKTGRIRNVISVAIDAYGVHLSKTGTTDAFYNLVAAKETNQLTSILNYLNGSIGKGRFLTDAKRLEHRAYKTFVAMICLMYTDPKIPNSPASSFMSGFPGLLDSSGKLKPEYNEGMFVAVFDLDAPVPNIKTTLTEKNYPVVVLARAVIRSSGSVKQLTEGEIVEAKDLLSAGPAEDEEGWLKKIKALNTKIKSPN